MYGDEKISMKISQRCGIIYHYTTFEYYHTPTPYHIIELLEEWFCVLYFFKSIYTINYRQHKVIKMCVGISLKFTLENSQISQRWLCPHFNLFFGNLRNCYIWLWYPLSSFLSKRVVFFASAKVVEQMKRCFRVEHTIERIGIYNFCKYP